MNKLNVSHISHNNESVVTLMTSPQHGSMYRVHSVPRNMRERTIHYVNQFNYLFSFYYDRQCGQRWAQGTSNLIELNAFLTQKKKILLLFSLSFLWVGSVCSSSLKLTKAKMSTSPPQTTPAAPHIRANVTEQTGIHWSTIYLHTVPGTLKCVCMVCI